MGKVHADALAKDNVEYMQGNLTNASSIERIYTEDVPGSGSFNIVFNLAAETMYSQPEEVYKEKVLDLSTMCAAEAVKQGVQRFVEVSTAQVYDSNKSRSKEDANCKPWTSVANYKLQAEKVLKGMEGLPLNIVRPAIVYGPGDISGISPRLICGAVYKFLGEKMKFLWGSELRLETVHVNDVCKALWHIATQCPIGETYNLADKNETDQGKINALLESIYGIKCGFVGNMKSTVAQKMGMKSVTDTINDKHLKPWSDLCKEANILSTPITPYLDKELLYNHQLAVDGTKIEDTGFTYDYPVMTEELLREQIQYFVDQNLFPDSVLQ
eukprot:CAMPEP_0174257374 /NCGR_PEP_ID=MMETSP0439-20130205/6519_1 /TAXON_ID=0 /ORGANISM="Stereomyxa ramosa, Strain Chinc5" /LENGTH=326 /DNA_ID=CAMNT_0015340439 /DNA_START=206 /DNA_END=1186 /DNA_ORIENTATION=+